MSLNRARRLCALLLSSLAAAAPAGATCEPRSVLHDADTPRTVTEFVAASGMGMLTFVGYSGAGYQDEAAMRALARQELARFDPARTIVNIGATAQGIGAVYEVARERGFFTLGIVSSLARGSGEMLSPCVDAVFFVRDSLWGGRLPGLTALSPTSAAIVDNSVALVGIGGGEVARDELLAARAAGKSVRFFAADMNHGIARNKALARGQPVPTDFRGAAQRAAAGALRQTGMASIAEALAARGLVLPAPMRTPPGMVLPFAFVRVVGRRALVSGHGPLAADGSLAPPLGKVGRELTLEQGYAAARLTGLAILGSLQRELGDLERIAAWTRVFGMVNSGPGFNRQPSVINGFSDLILELFGPVVGAHSRSAVGMAELPFDIPVEIEAEVELRD